MKIAMIGHKDFPCRSGGVEVVVYELATRLAARGEDVTVYNRGRQRGHNRYRVEGVNVIRSFTFRRQSLNAMVYSFTATLGALRRRYDIMHYHAIGPCVPLVIAHAFGRRTVATVHGLNWRVDKWRGFASKYIKLGERIAAKYADEVITLSDEMHRYFLDTYGRDTALIRNAVSPVPPTDIGIIREKYGLEKNGFILYVGRISPEKGIDELIEAYKRARPDERLIIAGEIGSDPFGCAVRAAVDGCEDIVCTGFVSGEELYALYCCCALYVLPSHTEGLALTLLEAMSGGASCLVSDIPENTTVLGNFGSSFRVSDVDELAARLLDAPRTGAPERDGAAQIAYVLENYGYDRVIDEHMEIYRRVCKGGKKERHRGKRRSVQPPSNVKA